MVLRFLTAGESHGYAQIAIIEGLPAGLALNAQEINFYLKKRTGGAGRGGRGRIEKDKVKILSGVRLGKTIGSPITLLIKNIDYKNWKSIMSPEPLALAKLQKVTKPRPGHADLAGVLKYESDDIRNILERASARETVMRVAVGTVFRKFLKEFDIEIASHVIQIRRIRLPQKYFQKPTSALFKLAKNAFAKNPLTNCVDNGTSQKMIKEIEKTSRQGDTLGGVIEIIVHNVPIGLGSHVHWDRKIDARIAFCLMSIPSVKAVEIGEGVRISALKGSEVQDEIFESFKRKTNRLGGIEGGITNGEDIICRVYHKPISTLKKPLKTVDIKTKKQTKAHVERSDVCVIPRAGVIAESMLAYVFTDEFLRKFGGDSIGEIKRNYQIL